MNLFQDLKQAFEKGMEQVGNQSQRMIELTRLNGKLKGKKESIQEMYNKLGQLVYDEWEKKQQVEVTGEVHQTLEMIQDLKKQIVQLEEKIDQLKHQNTGSSLAQKLPSSDLFANTGSPQMNPKMSVPVAILYLCPFCAHQVKEDDHVCSNCQVRFY
ncbi:hypothetical protein [Thermoflavimicrobium dichotomicum]|uniref:Zinc ribbon domain-containing protein n=1 Tax=Thermoflavimicrobium dichotomicum TaxID=46223 RepID=A0A1I3MQ61_9BACL|nr:hypothetical protein [Thermoflavimicrobium dichotomicum]SFI99117.1 hypothetical protein SAMN05421852_103157 [Thermoflavimicrobium dichotomicum]